MEKYEKLKDSFKRNGMKLEVFKNQEEMREKLLEDISENEDITIGGSITIDELGIYDLLRSRGNKVKWHWKEDSSTDVDNNIYMSSSNAITEDGKLVNMDGVGNRITSMIFGYERVFIFVGKNKLVKNYDQAIKRIKEVAGPLNAKRLKKATPCVKTGICSDCNSPDRICRGETIIHKGFVSREMRIYLIDENLGY